jgi:hypothetical protein
MDVTSTWTWRVDRLVRLMMLANRRAVWHRYQLGRQQRTPAPLSKLSPLKPAHRYHQAPLTDSELVALQIHLLRPVPIERMDREP